MAGEALGRKVGAVQDGRNPRYDDGDGDYVFDPLGIIEDLPEGKLRTDPHLWAEGEEFCRREGCTMPFWAASLTPLVVKMYGFEPCPVLDVLDIEVGSSAMG